MALRRRDVVLEAETDIQGRDLAPWVFMNRVDRPIDALNLVHRVWLPLLEKAGLRRIRFHDLRHTFASLLIQNGESLAYVKDQMGHSSLQVTVDVYGHFGAWEPRRGRSARRRATKRNPAQPAAAIVGDQNDVSALNAV